jgi:hypothetical protein
MLKEQPPKDGKTMKQQDIEKGIKKISLDVKKSDTVTPSKLGKDTTKIYPKWYNAAVLGASPFEKSVKVSH